MEYQDHRLKRLDAVAAVAQIRRTPEPVRDPWFKCAQMASCQSQGSWQPYRTLKNTLCHLDAQRGFACCAHCARKLLCLGNMMPAPDILNDILKKVRKGTRRICGVARVDELTECSNDVTINISIALSALCTEVGSYQSLSGLRKGSFNLLLDRRGSG
jgi:hypothetical protein